MHAALEPSFPAWEMGSCWSGSQENEEKYRTQFGTGSEDVDDRALPHSPKDAWVEDKESFKLSGKVLY